MITGINHVTISVQAIDRAFAFYRDVLQLKPVMKSNRSAYFTAGPTWIALDQRGEFQPSANYAHIAFAVPPAQFAELCSRLREHQVIEWQDNHTEGDSLYMRDDSGNKLEIHASTLEQRVRQGKAEWGPDAEWFV